MSKTKAFLTLSLLVLLGSMGAAQAQNLRYEMSYSDPGGLRPGKGAKARLSGDVLLNFAPVPSEFLTATLKYSATSYLGFRFPGGYRLDDKPLNKHTFYGVGGGRGRRQQ